MRDLIYLMRGVCSFRNVTKEVELAKFLLSRHNVIPIQLSQVDIISQYNILKNSKLLIFVSGSAGLATINCTKETLVIEISPRSIFLADVENHDAITRGGRHIVYICDTQSKEMSHTGDPVWIGVDYCRLSKFLTEVLKK